MSQLLKYFSSVSLCLVCLSLATHKHTHKGTHTSYTCILLVLFLWKTPTNTGSEHASSPQSCNETVQETTSFLICDHLDLPLKTPIMGRVTTWKMTELPTNKFPLRLVTHASLLFGLDSSSGRRVLRSSSGPNWSLLPPGPAGTWTRWKVILIFFHLQISSCSSLNYQWNGCMKLTPFQKDSTQSLSSMKELY